MFLAGSDKFRRDFGEVMGHAGAAVLESLEDCSSGGGGMGEDRSPATGVLCLLVCNVFVCARGIPSMRRCARVG